MKRANKERADAQRLEVAADWMLRLRESRMSEEDIVRWVQWCESDALNQQAFDRLQELWKLSSGLAGEVVEGELTCARRKRLRSGSGPLTEVCVRIASRWSVLVGHLHIYRRAYILAAGNIAALVFGITLWLLRGPFGGLPLRNDQLMATATAEAVHEAVLSDGSKIDLAARSAVVVHYSEHDRVLALQSGEAYFSVAPNPRRPFIVAAGATCVRAVGTAFNVRRAGQRVVVTVVHGIVDVYANDAKDDDVAAISQAPGPHALRVGAGEQVIWDGAGYDPVVSTVDPAMALTWREGRLEYSNEPLAAVVADLNRYTEQPVIIRGEAVGQLRYSGTLLIKDTAEWLRALPSEFPVEVLHQAGADIITPRPKIPSS